MVSSLAVRREEDKNMIHKSNVQMFEHVDAWWTRLMRLPSASCLAMRSCSSRAFFSSSSILLSSAAIGFRLSEKKKSSRSTYGTCFDCQGGTRGRKLTQARREHANSSQKSQWDLNPGPSHCEAAVLTTPCTVDPVKYAVYDDWE